MHPFSSYDVIVIGAGHAGIEAALASARLGAKTAVLTLSLDAVGNLPCNPSIGGTAKGHLVFELSALGGEMGRVADATTIQSRMLNLAKGPAVHSLRVQSDRRAYSAAMKQVLELQAGLDLIQDEAVAIETGDQGVRGVRTLQGAVYAARNVVVATGTYLGGRIYLGDTAYDSGPDSVRAATALVDSLRALGLPLRRFKTGTPARAHRRSIDFTKLGVQTGDERTVPFWFMDDPPVNRVVCHIAHTNERTHDVIRRNIGRSPLYGGKIEGVGARYCPSIEDKVYRFPDKTRHQIFVEPCGLHTDEMYLQGMSSSLPLDVQLEMYRTIEGFERIELMRPAYAIEYECCDPLQLLPTLAVKTVPGLYGAGQFNGTSGYEEAAAQGFVAGVNAAHRALGRPPFVLTRQHSYIGALIDDLVTKGTNEPYRMMTARSEFRLLLRQDNADLRLCETGRALGLLPDDAYAVFRTTRDQLETQTARLQKDTLPPGPALNAVLVQAGGAPMTSGAAVAPLLRRPGVHYADLRPFDPGYDAAVPDAVYTRAEIDIKYEGYLRRQQLAVDRQQRQEGLPLDPGLDYAAVTGLRIEARDKLNRVKPLSLGQAARISGVNPADIAVLTIHLKKTRKEPADD